MIEITMLLRLRNELQFSENRIIMLVDKSRVLTKRTVYERIANAY